MQNSAFEINHFPKNRTLRVGKKLITIDRPLVMGILNLTPDSFYSGSRVNDFDELLRQVDKMIEEGADIIDIGGYSTRPGALDVSETDELNRVVPAIQRINQEYPEILISIDTFRAKVAEESIQNGASVINDVSGFSIDPEIIHIAANYHIPYILMHMRGTPQTMQNYTEYDNLFTDMISYFSNKTKELYDAGVMDVIIDPGFGFSKTLNQNFELLNHLESFQILDAPLLVGISRKSMIYKKLGIQPEDALNGTIALNAIALSKGASILRVHDVAEAKQLIDLLF